MLKDLIASVVSRFAHEFYVLRLWLTLTLDIVSEVELDKHKWITLDEPKCLTSSPALIFIQTDPVPDAPEGHRSIFLNHCPFSATGLRLAFVLWFSSSTFLLEPVLHQMLGEVVLTVV